MHRIFKTLIEYILMNIKRKINSIYYWLDREQDHKYVKLANQLIPVVVCLILFMFFISISYLLILYGINKVATNKIVFEFSLMDIGIGFFLYFVTAVDYALIVGRMQVANPGSKARLIMNVFTCVGCFFGVTLVLLIWGFARDISWLILPLLIFAGSVMIKLAYEGIGYFQNAKYIPQIIRTFTTIILKGLYYITNVFTFWIPKIATPDVKPMAMMSLAKWSFLLPFIIGLDDLIGYMGAMTIYNVMGLLIGIYLADIFIDILIFVAPSLTKKVVNSAILSLIAAYAFMYLAFKSFTESYILLKEKFIFSNGEIFSGVLIFILIIFLIDLVILKTNPVKK